MVESLETILKAESSPEYFILSFNETNDLLSLFCLLELIGKSSFLTMIPIILVVRR